MSTISKTAEIEVGAVRFLIDAEDAPRVARHRGHLFDNKRGHVYAQTNIRVHRPDGSSYQKKVRLHRFLLDAEGGVVDHISRDTTDNRKENLRLVDCSVNSINRKRANGGPLKTKDGWVVRVQKNGERAYHGFFQSLEAAKNKFDQVTGDSYVR